VKLSHDHTFIEQAFRETIKVDSFVKHLYDIYSKTREDQPEKPEFHIVRSDYMRDA